MYKYFSELEDRKNFGTVLYNNILDYEESRICNAKIPTDFFQKYQDVFQIINVIDLMIIKGKEDKDYCERMDVVIEFETMLCEAYEHVIYLKSKLNLETFEIMFILEDYAHIAHLLSYIIPNQKESLQRYCKRLKSACKKLRKLVTIILPKEEYVNYIWPDAWYITPNGFPYNTGGVDGHKEGNLTYAKSYAAGCRSEFRTLAKKSESSLLQDNQKVSEYDIINNQIEEIKRELQDILKRGYITEYEFRTYCNFISLGVPNLLREKDAKGYQKNLITLVTGYLDAKICLLESYNRLRTIGKEAVSDMNCFFEFNRSDEFVQFLGFHKVETMLDKTITTSSLLQIGEFEEYLKHGWMLHVIPPVIYNTSLNRAEEMDLNGLIVSKYLEQFEDNPQIKIFKTRSRKR